MENEGEDERLVAGNKSCVVAMAPTSNLSLLSEFSKAVANWWSSVCGCLHLDVNSRLPAVLWVLHGTNIQTSFSLQSLDCTFVIKFCSTPVALLKVPSSTCHSCLQNGNIFLHTFIITCTPPQLTCSHATIFCKTAFSGRHKVRFVRSYGDGHSFPLSNAPLSTTKDTIWIES